MERETKTLTSREAAFDCRTLELISDFSERSENPAIYQKQAGEEAPGIPKRKFYGDLSKLQPGTMLDMVIQHHLARRAGCFAADTPIKMHDGTVRPIADVKAGDLVATPFGSRKVIRRFDNGISSDWLLLQFSGKSITVTPRHHFFVIDVGWVPVLWLSGVKYATTTTHGLRVRKQDVRYLRKRVQDEIDKSSYLRFELSAKISDSYEAGKAFGDSGLVFPEEVYDLPNGVCYERGPHGNLQFDLPSYPVSSAKWKKKVRGCRSHTRPAPGSGYEGTRTPETRRVPRVGRRKVTSRLVWGEAVDASRNRRPFRCKPCSCVCCTESPGYREKRETYPAVHRKDEREEQLRLEGRHIQRGDCRFFGRVPSEIKTTPTDISGAWERVRMVFEAGNEISVGGASHCSVPVRTRTPRRLTPMHPVSRPGRKGVPDSGWSVFRIERLSGVRESRFDLEVEDVHCYFAGGFLVHNSHYDFRFGDPTGLFSWATRYQLPAPGNKSLLIQQPMHSYKYKDFEGEIPEGYGAGTVRRHSEGKLLITGVSPTAIHFTLAHPRYPERFVLVKPPKSKSQHHWLLINKTPVQALPYNKVRYKKIPTEKVEGFIHKMQQGETLEAKVDGASSLIRLLKDGVEVVSYRTSKKTGRPIVHTEKLMQDYLGRKLDIPKHLIGTVLKGETYGVGPRETAGGQPVQNSIGLHRPASGEVGGDAEALHSGEDEGASVGPTGLGYDSPFVRRVLGVTGDGAGGIASDQTLAGYAGADQSAFAYPATGSEEEDRAKLSQAGEGESTASGKHGSARSVDSVSGESRHRTECLRIGRGLVGRVDEKAGMVPVEAREKHSGSGDGILPGQLRMACPLLAMVGLQVVPEPGDGILRAASAKSGNHEAADILARNMEEDSAASERQGCDGQKQGLSVLPGRYVADPPAEDAAGESTRKGARCRGVETDKQSIAIGGTKSKYSHGGIKNSDGVAAATGGESGRPPIPGGTAESKVAAGLLRATRDGNRNPTISRSEAGNLVDYQRGASGSTGVIGRTVLFSRDSEPIKSGGDAPEKWSCDGIPVGFGYGVDFDAVRAGLGDVVERDGRHDSKIAAGPARSDEHDAERNGPQSGLVASQDGASADVRGGNPVDGSGSERGTERVLGPQELGGILNSSLAKALDTMRQRNVRLRSMIYDIQQLGNQPIDWNEVSRLQRRAMIEEVLRYLPPEVFHISEAAETPEKAEKLWSSIQSGQHPLTNEGVVMWPLHGTPMKSKLVEDSDVVIRNVFPGEGKYKDTAAGGFEYSLPDSEDIVGRVGTGFSDEMRRDLWENRNDYLGRRARIKSQQQYPSGAYRAPAFLALHEDY